MQMIQSQNLTMSSREIAELVCSRHDDVKRCITRLASDHLNDDGSVKRAAVIQLPPMAGVKNHLGQTVSEYRVPKRDSYIIVAQLCPEFTARLVDRWQELEAGQSAPAFQIPTTLSGALRLAAEQAEQIEEQKALLIEQKPSVEFVEHYVESIGLMGFRQVAKLIGANERHFKQMLLDHGICYHLAGNLTPKADQIKAGRFVVKTGAADNEHAFVSMKLTPKGVAYVSELWRGLKG